MQKSLLIKVIHILLLIVLIFGILYIAHSLLIPLTIAGVLAMLFMPFSGWLEYKGFSRGMAALICVFCFMMILGFISFLLTWQITAIADDISGIKKSISYGLNEVQQFVSRSFGISRDKQNQMIDGETNSGSGAISQTVAAVMQSLLNILFSLILTLVYMFLLLFFRHRLKNFILMVVPAAEQEKTEKIIAQSARVVQKYLTGLTTIICMLWVMYGIGFSIVGIKSAFLFAILCGLLEVVPFVGNITGSSLTVLMAFSQGGGIQMALGVLFTYIIIQCIQFYIISPMVLGSEVNVNPLFTIIVLIAGELLWGIPGMILAIPILGITKIIGDNVEQLHPYSYLIGQEKNSRVKSGMVLQRVKKMIRRP